MFSNKLLALAVLCGMAFACGGVRADENTPAKEKVVQKFAVIQTRLIDADEAAAVLKKLMPPETTIVRLPLISAILVYGTDTELVQMRKMLEPL
jgi:hypothetical protein